MTRHACVPIPRPVVHEEVVVNMLDAHISSQLAAERRQRLLDEADRHRRLRRRPVALPTPPLDAA